MRLGKEIVKRLKKFSKDLKRGNLSRYSIRRYALGCDCATCRKKAERQ